MTSREEPRPERIPAPGVGPAARAVLVLALALLLAGTAAPAQEADIVRTGPPASDDLERDANGDGIPDGWYSARDAVRVSKGGKVGPHFIRLETTRRGRPSGISRAFGVDGRKYEAIIIGVWLRMYSLQHGERLGQEPSLLIDFLGDQLRHLTRGVMGPWTRTVGSNWTRVAKRIAVPAGTRDAIMSLGLMGARGIMDFDGVTFELVPREDVPTTNLVVNGDFELGDPTPAHWAVNNDAYRVFPGYRSSAAVELAHSNARVLTGLALPVTGIGGLRLSVVAEGRNLRGAGGAEAAFYFLDEFGRPIPGTAVALPFGWGGSFDWRREVGDIHVPPGARRAVVQFDKIDNAGRLRIDDVTVTALPNAEVASWTPYHADDDTSDWIRVEPTPTIAARSALDFSFLVPGPAGARGFVTLKDGRLTFEKGGRARFHGVTLLPPTAFLEADRADQLADQLARSGINLVRLGDLDTAVGPDRSLFDDSRDDTKAFDPSALARLDHLVAALKSRGVYVALELQSNRRFRDEDGVLLPGLLPAGGGPPALFDARLKRLELDSARALLAHKNGETGLALKDEPALAWVTLLGEVSLFNLIERSDEALPGDYAQALRTLAQKTTAGSGRRFWQSLEAAHHKEMTEALRKDGLRVPIAGCSHWRRESEFAAAQAGAGLDLVDDRLFWLPPPFIAPEKKSQLWNSDATVWALARQKRQPDLAYAAGQWCSQTQGAWAFPFEAADTLFGAAAAVHDDWDALVRRGIFLNPQEWGQGPAGTAGGEDIFQIPEVANASPQVYSLWPHIASLLLRGQAASTGAERGNDPDRSGRGQAATPRRRSRGQAVSGWDPAQGRLVIDTPFTQGIAGWFRNSSNVLTNLDISTDSDYALIVASSAGPEPIATSKRLLVTLIGRVAPTGLKWVDPYQREVADPGGPPLLQEPVFARVSWRRKGKIQGYKLSSGGERAGEAKLEPLPEGAGATLVIDGRTAGFHWELTCD